MEELKRSIDGVRLSYLWQNLLYVLRAGTGTTFCSSLISVSLNSGAHCPSACHRSQHGPVLVAGLVGLVVWGFFGVVCLFEGRCGVFGVLFVFLVVCFN